MFKTVLNSFRTLKQCLLPDQFLNTKRLEYLYLSVGFFIHIFLSKCPCRQLIEQINCDLKRWVEYYNMVCEARMQDNTRRIMSNSVHREMKNEEFSHGENSAREIKYIYASYSGRLVQILQARNIHLEICENKVSETKEYIISSGVDDQPAATVEVLQAENTPSLEYDARRYVWITVRELTQMTRNRFRKNPEEIQPGNRVRNMLHLMLLSK